MAIDRDDIIKKALEAIEDEECVTIEELCLFIPCGKTTFYALGLNDVNEIKEAIETMKVKLKKGMRRNWRKSENPALQIAEFKLMGTDQEIEKITISKVKSDNIHTVRMPQMIEEIDYGTTQDNQIIPGE